MIELPMVFFAGMLGTAHCLGMCGPFAMMVGGTTRGWSAALLRQLAYTAGRVFTYGVLGAAAGYGGMRLAEVWPTAVNVPAVLAIVAGLFLVYQGLLAARLLPKRAIGATRIACVAGGFMGQFLRQPGATSIFVAGILNGLLPCGLLYGMLALATSTHSVVGGGVTMMVFGLGTAPAMIAAGLGGRLIGLATRQRLLSVAAWCLMLTGVLSIMRGASFFTTGERAVTNCPFCQP